MEIVTVWNVENNPAHLLPLVHHPPMALSAQKKTTTAEEFHPETLGSKLKEDDYRDGHSDIERFGELVVAERDNEIKYRTCSWQKVGNFHVGMHNKYTG